MKASKNGSKAKKIGKRKTSITANGKRIAKGEVPPGKTLTGSFRAGKTVYTVAVHPGTQHKMLVRGRVRRAK